MSEINVGKLTLTGDGLKLLEVTSFPAGQTGQLVWDANEGLLKVYNGTEWVVTPGTVPHPVGNASFAYTGGDQIWTCLLYTSPSPRDLSTSRMPSSA